MNGTTFPRPDRGEKKRFFKNSPEKKNPPELLLYTGDPSMFLATSLHAFSTAALPPPRPNIVVLFADDFGWGDLHSYGHSTQERGRLDEMASEGVRFTSWYSADSLCTPSRSAMMTGRLPVRTGMIPPGQSSARVLSSTSTKGLPRNETSLAEMLQAKMAPRD